MLWDLNEGKHLYTLDAGEIINSMCFSPNRYWLCAACGPQVKIWVSRNETACHCLLPIPPTQICRMDSIIQIVCGYTQSQLCQRQPAPSLQGFSHELVCSNLSCLILIVWAWKLNDRVVFSPSVISIISSCVLLQSVTTSVRCSE